jgi:Tol biopolymer transport system component
VLPTPPPHGDGHIAFTSNRKGIWQIFIMNADGSRQTLLTHDRVYDAEPAWSPDGTRIAFQSKYDSRYVQLCVINENSSSQTRLADNKAFDGSRTWSPNGSRIAFVFERDGNYETNVMNANGTGQTRLTKNSVYDG